MKRSVGTTIPAAASATTTFVGSAAAAGSPLTGFGEVPDVSCRGWRRARRNHRHKSTELSYHNVAEEVQGRAFHKNGRIVILLVGERLLRSHEPCEATSLPVSASRHCEAMALPSALRDCSELYQFWSYGRSRDPERDIVAEHREIAERTRARDQDGAVAALTDHIERTTTRLVAYLELGRIQP